MLASKIDWFVNTFGGKDGWILVACGFLFLIWFLYEVYRRKGFIHSKKEEWDLDITVPLKLIIYLGVILGLIAIGTSIVGMVYDIPPSDKMEFLGKNDKFTSVLLLIVGFIIFIKPTMDIPWATLIAFLAGTGVVFAIVFLIPNSALEAGVEYLNVNMKWILLTVFLIVFGIVSSMLKFWFGLIETFAKFVSWPPIALLMSLLCLVQGFGVVFFGWSFSLI